MPDIFALPFVQRGLIEIAVLSVGAALLGTWIVLRGLAFFAHAVGTAAFPGLVLAEGLAFPALLGALGAAAALAGVVALVSARGREDTTTATALALVAALAVGALLAGEAFSEQVGVEQLLFGSLLLVDTTDMALAGALSVAALAATLVFGHRWLAAGFDAAGARAIGLRSGFADVVLLALVAVGAIATLSILGALLGAALLVVPAATTRLITSRLLTWQLATAGFVLAQGVLGLWLSVELNAPSGATLAVLGAVVFCVVAALRVVLAQRRSPAAAAAASGRVGA